MLLLVYGVIRLEHSGNGWGGTVGAFAAGLALLALFVVIERRSADPLLRLGILRSGPLVRANLGALLFLGSFAGFQFLATLYLQELRGWSTLQTGLAMLVIGVDAVLAPTLTPRLVNRFGNVPVLFEGWSWRPWPTCCSCPSGWTGPTPPCCRPWSCWDWPSPWPTAR
ncbi:hypothetical protein ACFQX6_59405 [Streptosporangium lutulentum]